MWEFEALPMTASPKMCPFYLLEQLICYFY